MHTNIDLPEEFKKHIVDSINNGVGDDVKKVLRNEGINPKYSNSKGKSAYDYINRNLRRKSNIRFSTEFSKVNAWNYIPIYDNLTGFIYVLMKRSRFEELKREKCKKENKSSFHHYIFANTKIINEDILPEFTQISIFLEPEDEHVLYRKVENMLNDIHIPRDMVNRFALILFDVSEYELTSISCCIPDSDFKIRYSQSWDEYINHQDSVIPETIDSDNIIKNEETRGTSNLLGYTDKAKSKMGQEKNAKTKKEEKENQEDK